MNEALRKKTLLAFYFVVLVDNLSFSLTFTLFPSLFIDSSYLLVSSSLSLHVRNFLLGIGFIAFPLAQFFGAPVLGDIADLRGRRFALLISVVGASVSVVLSAISISLHSVALLILSRLLAGFFAGNLSISLAGISDLSLSEEERGKNFGYVAALMGASWVFSMILGGFFSSQKIFSYFGPIIAFWVIVAFTLVNLVIVYLYVNETHEMKVSHKIDILGGIKNIVNALKLKGVKGYFLIYFLWVCGWGGAIQWFGSYAILTFKTKPFAISIAFLINGIFWTLGGSIINARAVKVFSSFTLTWIGYLVIAPLIFSMGIYSNFYTFCIPIIAGAIFGALSMTHTLNLISLKASEDIQGKIMGLSQSIQALGWIFTAALAIIFFSIASNYYFYVIGLLLFVAFLLTLFLHSSKKLAKENYQHGT